jgi:hypothetical protein
MVESKTYLELSRVDSNAIPWLAYPLIPNSFFKILKVDEDSNTVILRYKMGPNVVTPMHAHHCVATAFTLAGVWYYDDLEFRAGDLAFEKDVKPHQPYTKQEGAELLTTFIGGRGNDVLLEEFPEGGGSYLLRTGFFKALCGITAEQLAAMDLRKLLD